MWDANESILLPDPERLSGVALDGDGSAEVSQVLRRLPRGRDANTTLQALRPYVRAAQARGQEPTSAPAGLSPIEREFDAYFGVRRDSTAAPLRLFHDAVLVAYAQMLEESLLGHTLRPVEFGQLSATLEDLLHRSAPRGDEPLTAAAAPDEPAPIGGVAAVLRRWRRGHWVFFVLIEGLVLAHDALCRCLSAGDEAGALDALRLATDLWWAAGAALPFAGDLPPGSYESVVRPSMKPPQTSREFSGLHSVDHAVLIRRLRAMREKMANLPESLRTQHQSYLWSLSVVYQSHAAVCEHFVGNKASLSGQRTGARPAPEVLRDTLQKRTLALAGA